MASERQALALFVSTIESTGGITKIANGMYAPVGDPEWIDLAEAYLAACSALDRTPLYAEEDDE